MQMTAKRRPNISPCLSRDESPSIFINIRTFLNMRIEMQTTAPTFMRRKDAAEYLKSKFGFGACSTLAKGVVTGDSPTFHKAGRVVLYTQEALDEWALGKISAPRRSSSDARSPDA
jgi:hypothetical protein